jgi:ATP-dependent DNA helicase HFM1/MER3
MRGASVKPQIAASTFPPSKSLETERPASHQSNMSKRRTDAVTPSRKVSTASDDYGDGGLDDDALVSASYRDLDFDHIENYADPIDTITRKNTMKNKATKGKDDGKSKRVTRSLDATPGNDETEPVQLPNGKWACNHSCKDRKACKHLCCKTGMDKPSKKKIVPKRVGSGEDRLESTQKTPLSKRKETQTKLQLTASKRKSSAPIDELDLTQQEKKAKPDLGTNGPRNYRDLDQLHKTIQGTELPSSLHSVKDKKPAYCYSQCGELSLDFMDRSDARRHPTSSDYSDIQFDEPSAYFNESHDQPAQHDSSNNMPEPGGYMDYEPTGLVASHRSDAFDDNDSLQEAMIGLADSQELQQMRESDGVVMQPLESTPDDADNMRLEEDDNEIDAGMTGFEDDVPQQRQKLTHHNYPHKAPIKTSRLPFFHSTSSAQPELAIFVPAKVHTPPDTRQQPPIVTALRSTGDQQLKDVSDLEEDVLGIFDEEPVKNPGVEEKRVPEAFRDLEPWLFQEFGDIVEFVDE